MMQLTVPPFLFPSSKESVWGFLLVSSSNPAPISLFNRFRHLSLLFIVIIICFFFLKFERDDTFYFSLRVTTTFFFVVCEGKKLFRFLLLVEDGFVVGDCSEDDGCWGWHGISDNRILLVRPCTGGRGQFRKPNFA